MKNNTDTKAGNRSDTNNWILEPVALDTAYRVTDTAY